MENINNRESLLVALENVIDDRIELLRVEHLEEYGQPVSTDTDDVMATEQYVDTAVSDCYSSEDFDIEDYATHVDIADALTVENLNADESLDNFVDDKLYSYVTLETYDSNVGDFVKHEELDKLIDDRIRSHADEIFAKRADEAIRKMVDQRFQELARTLRQNMAQALDFE